MLRNHLRIALRHLARHKGHAFISIAGLAVGLAVCLLILLFVRDELAYDRFHEKVDRIYRVSVHMEFLDRTYDAAISPAPLASALEAAFPGVERTVRIDSYGNQFLTTYGEKTFYEDAFLLADSTFFEIFDFPLVRGNPSTALTDPYSVVLTGAMADKYFGEADPIGRTLTIQVYNDTLDFRVTGVLAPLTAGSHLHFNFIGSFSTKGPHQRSDSWSSLGLQTYVLLEEGYLPEALEAGFPAFIAQHTEQDAGMKYEPFLQPLTDLHLFSKVENEMGPTGDVRYVYIFLAAALLVLLVACINYVNLVTARSALRAKEIGVRKIVGAYRGQLVRQFVAESLLSVLLAFLLALGLAALVLPTFNGLVDKNLTLAPLVRPEVLVGVALAILAIGIGAGSYPALFLSAMKPLWVVKSAGSTSPRSGLFRKGLVVVQFATCVLLVACTLIVYEQLHYVQHARLGFDREQVIVVPMRDRSLDPAVYKQAVLQQRGVRGASVTSMLPGQTNISRSGVRLKGRDEDEPMVFFQDVRVDDDFQEVLGLELIAGRFLSEAYGTDAEGAVVLNETAARQVNAEEPIGATFERGDRQQQTVIGVVRDFHNRSLHEPIEPMMIRLGGSRFMAVQVDGTDIPAVLRFMEARWAEVAPERPFVYSFMDDDLARQYGAERKLGQIFGVFAGLTILVAYLGLFGLMAFTARRRTREIGIRKVLGATVRDIVVLLGRGTVALMVLAAVVAWPVAHMAMSRWLEDFAYRIDLHPGTFLLAGLIALVVGVATVGYHAIRAAAANPADSLRYE